MEPKKRGPKPGTKREAKPKEEESKQQKIIISEDEAEKVEEDEEEHELEFFEGYETTSLVTFKEEKSQIISSNKDCAQSLKIL